MTRLPPRIATLVMLASGALAAEPTAPTPNDATAATRAINRAQLAGLPQNDQRDFEAAQRGLIEATPNLSIPGPSGMPAFTLQGYEFLENTQAPDTANPALWRHARLNM